MTLKFQVGDYVRISQVGREAFPSDNDKGHLDGEFLIVQADEMGVYPYRIKMHHTSNSWLMYEDELEFPSGEYQMSLPFKWRIK